MRQSLLEVILQSVGFSFIIARNYFITVKRDKRFETHWICFNKSDALDLALPHLNVIHRAAKDAHQVTALQMKVANQNLKVQRLNRHSTALKKVIE